MPHTRNEALHDTQAIEDELLALEKRYWQALKDNDVQAALELTDDPCIVTGAQGVANLSKDNMAGMMRSANYRLDDFYINSDVQVRQLSDDTAVLAYNVRERLTVDGKTVTMEAADASTWVRRDGRWLCALHTESLKGDPFGRDRATS